MSVIPSTVGIISSRRRRRYVAMAGPVGSCDHSLPGAGNATR